MKAIYAVVTVIVLIIFTGHPARAESGIDFTLRANPVLEQKLYDFFETFAAGDRIPYHPERISLARVRLNDDSIPEILLRYESTEGQCLPPAGCLYIALADRGHHFTELGRFKALRVTKGKRGRSGHLVLHACRNPWDDFDCLAYTYNPGIGKYVRAQDAQ